MGSVNPATEMLWLIFLALWVAASLLAKQNVRSWALWRGIATRAAVVCGTVLLFDVPFMQRFGLYAQETLAIGTNPAIITIGVALCAFGLLIALWARVHLGKNWGAPLSLRRNHELVTSGPYRLARHPIYAGILVALFGSGLAEGVVSMAIFVAFSAYFAYCAKLEDRMMAREFPDVYHTYADRTKMLVPYLL